MPLCENFFNDTIQYIEQKKKRLASLINSQNDFIILVMQLCCMAGIISEFYKVSSLKIHRSRNKNILINF